MKVFMINGMVWPPHLPIVTTDLVQPELVDMQPDPTILTREGLYPKWADLSQRADVARARFRDGGPEVLFRDALKRLGFSWSQIQLEVAQNSPRKEP